MNMVKKDTKRESMQKDAPKQMGKLESLHEWKKSRMHMKAGMSECK